MLKKTLLISSLLFATSSYATSFTTNITGGTITSNFSMNVKSSCSAAVNDLDFGTKTATEIINGVTAQTMRIEIKCDSIPTYTIKLDANNGLSNAGTGTIKTLANASIVYQLMWGDATISTANSYVTSWGTVITPQTKATAATVSIPVSVKPIKNGSTVSPGAANTSINITIALN